MMTLQETSALLKQHNIKPTSNRILVARTLAVAGRPLSLMELEQRIQTIDKSNISRTLTRFREHRLLHTIESEGEGMRYELCMSSHHESDDDLHVHFYCEQCHKTFCLEHLPVPPIDVPEGFCLYSASYMLKGLCPLCAQKVSLSCR